MNYTPDLSDVAYNYSYVFEFEKNWDELAFWKYTRERWTDSFVYATIYVVVIFSIKHFMKNRRAFDLRQSLAVWSGNLALFSIAGSLRTLPELISSLHSHGFQYSICIPTCYNGVTGFWGFLFTASKVYEFGDTLFIVLRKKPLIFLQWYHHVTVLIYSCYSYTDHTAAARWFFVMNFMVHSVMYTYYALKAMQIHVPKQISQLVTAMQLFQMLLGLFINARVYFIKNRGEFCNQTYTNLGFSTAMYFSYFLLFAHFFYKTYVISPKSRNAVKLE